AIYQARRLLPGDAAFCQCAQYPVLSHHRDEARPAFLSGDGIPLLDGDVETKRAPHAAPFFIRSGYFYRAAALAGVPGRWARGPTSGWPWVLASAPSSSFTPRAMAPVSLPAWK